MSRLRLTVVIMLLAGGKFITGAVASDPESKDRPALHPRVKIETTMGDLVLELDAEQAPLTVLNFVQYVEDKFYDQTVFHRVLPNQLIQGGAYTPAMEKKTAGLRDPLEDKPANELENLRGTIAMYRVPGRPNSTGVHFFINLADNGNLDLPRLDGRAYPVFGRVVEGLETGDRISQTPTSTHPKYAAGRSPVVPVKPVIIESVKLLTSFDREGAQAVADAAERQAREAVEQAARAKEEMLEARIKAYEKQADAKFVTTDSGLRYLDLHEGTGAPPIREEVVSFHYRGILLDGTEFENTYQYEEPKVQVITKLLPGIQEGMVTMREGGKRVLIVPPELGFGKDGIPNGRIPPNAILFYEIELLGIE